MIAKETSIKIISNGFNQKPNEKHKSCLFICQNIKKIKVKNQNRTQRNVWLTSKCAIQIFSSGYLPDFIVKKSTERKESHNVSSIKNKNVQSERKGRKPTQISAKGKIPNLITFINSHPKYSPIQKKKKKGTNQK